MYLASPSSTQAELEAIARGSVLRAMARSWITLANQMDRLEAIKIAIATKTGLQCTRSQAGTRSARGARKAPFLLKITDRRGCAVVNSFKVQVEAAQTADASCYAAFLRRCFQHLGSGS
jgi:hypothetical protein